MENTEKIDSIINEFLSTKEHKSEDSNTEASLPVQALTVVRQPEKTETEKEILPDKTLGETSSDQTDKIENSTTGAEIPQQEAVQKRRHLFLNGLVVCIELPAFILAMVYHAVKLLTCTGIFPDPGTGLSYSTFPKLKIVNIAAVAVLFLLIIWCMVCIFELSAREKYAPGRYLFFLIVAGVIAPVVYLIQVQVITQISVSALFRKKFVYGIGLNLLYILLSWLYYRINRNQFYKQSGNQ